MSSRQRVFAVFALALVVFAGCTAPVTPSPFSNAETPTTEPTTPDDENETAVPPASPEERNGSSGDPLVADGDVTVDEGRMPLDENLVFARVLRLMDADVQPGELVVVESDRPSTTSFWGGPLLDVMGITEYEADTSSPGGFTTWDGDIQVDKADGSRMKIEHVLVHELVHLVQIRLGMTPDLGQSSTYDEQIAKMSAVEGGAVYVTDEYIREYEAPGTELQSEEVASNYESGPVANSFLWARYYFGNQYVYHFADGPDELEPVYEENMPTTTEQVIHNYTPEEEPARPLSTTADVSDDADWHHYTDDRRGEMFLRVTLRGEVDPETAAKGADGWGNDHLYEFYHETSTSRYGIAWVIRWDSPEEAEEFLDVWETFAENRRAESNYEYRTVRVSDETVVVFAGDWEFVDNASAEGDDDSVDVTVE